MSSGTPYALIHYNMEKELYTTHYYYCSSCLGFRNAIGMERIEGKGLRISNPLLSVTTNGMVFMDSANLRGIDLDRGF